MTSVVVSETSFSLRTGEPLARYTAARIGGPADYLAMVESVEEQIAAVRLARERGWSWRVLGGGSNVLVSDLGVRGLVILNRARRVEFREPGVGSREVYAESGANLSSLARSCIARGWAGLTWAVNVPGTVGGAVVGNAGAQGGDVANTLKCAEILELDGTVAEWSVERFAYGYRDSRLKREAGARERVVLTATFGLRPEDPEALEARAAAYVARRKATQPSGASLGSTFKNPPGDYAGRLIEAVGLKGTQVGGARISQVHANFILNVGQASAADVKALIDLARERVQQRFGVELALEIELVGEWDL